ncbi:MAG: AMP-binding protein [Magnetospirillum sp.]|nr:AMP-binding protein [Magnetospirillum sp.]
MAPPQPNRTTEPFGTGEPVNITVEAVDRHVAEGRGARVALRFLSRHHGRRDVSFAQLSEMAARTARVLADRGIVAGDVVAALLPRGPELFATALGAWRIGAVFCPLFAAFGPGPIRARLELGGAKALVAGTGLYARKVAGHREALPRLTRVMLVADGDDRVPPGEDDFTALLAAADPAAAPAAATTAADPALLHFTSGTTGTPKGAVHTHGAVHAQSRTGRLVFGLSADDVYWCTADPGWVTCTAYGIIAPLACGAVSVVDEADFDARRWYATLRDQGVTAWYTTPTAIRMLMRYGAALARSHGPGSLRVAASVGELLNPEAVAWGEKALGVPFHDTWWQTETGAIAIANLPGACRPGSMGRPLPGVETAVVRRGLTSVEVIAEPDVVGELALKGLPSLFSAYLGDPERRRACFVDGWYLTGDQVRRDGDGFFWFVGRADDMIKCAAHTIGPFEIECTLADHPAVAEIGVVGKPDLLLREVPVAFVALNPGFEPGDALTAELLTFARQELGPALAPREIVFVETLPKTTTGKILRRALKAKAVAEPDEDEPLAVVPYPGRFDDE